MGWPESWRRDTWLTQLARPLALAYRGLSAWDRRRKRQRQQPLAVPVIVVGNLVVGGTGKTPFITWLVAQLRSQGHHPGIISRGFGGRSGSPHFVQPTDAPMDVGDEPLMLAQMTQAPVVVGRDRLAAAYTLLRQDPNITVLISDDGLQHLSLPRALEFCLFDGHSGVGNGRMLPSGPLREPLHRLQSVDAVVAKGRQATLPNWAPTQVVMELALGIPRHLHQPKASVAPHEVIDCVAVCGIGQPESFFQLLRQAGWVFTPMPITDHGTLTAVQMAYLTGRTVLVTSKDAVKLRLLELPFEAYEVPLTVSFGPQAHASLLDRLVNKVPLQPKL